MSCRRLVLNAAAAMASVVALGTAATGANMLGPPQEPVTSMTRSLELQPGMTKILKPGRPVQSIALGNPNIADASAINLDAIAITGKGIGLTNVILFDEMGKEISNTKIQVVESDVYKAGENVSAGHEVRVISLWGGPGVEGAREDRNKRLIDRRYLCAPACSYIQVDQPVSLNPEGTTNAPVASTTSSFTLVPQGPTTGAPAPGAPAPQGR